MGLPEDLIWPWDPADEDVDPVWGAGPFDRARVMAPTALQAVLATQPGGGVPLPAKAG